MFGGAAWSWRGGWEQHVLHSFRSSQPDLNLHEPAVQGVLLDVMQFWLKRGVDGIRLDPIDVRVADRHLRDNPARRGSFGTPHRASGKLVQPPAPPALQE